MYRNHLIYRPSSRETGHPFSKTGNALEIVNTDFIRDHERKQLILIVETRHMISRDVKAFVKGNSLLLEAPLIPFYDKPFRIHHLGKNTREEFEEGLTLIGFSEIKLKHGYQYHLISCQAFDTKMIKVILGFTKGDRNMNN